MRKILFTLALVAAAATASAQDWPQFLGPTGDSKSTQKNLLREWPAEGPKVVWSVPVGVGYGGPVVQSGRVFLLDRDAEKEVEIMRCMELATGKELWSYSYPSKGSVMYPGSRSVPAVDGNYVYACGHNGDFHCFDVKTGKVVWRKDIWNDFGGGKIPVWAISQCPLIYGDMVVVMSQAPDAGLVAYNKVSGEIVWKTPRLGDESYTSPTVVKINGQDHITIVISSTDLVMHRDLPKQMGKVIGFDPKTGKELWRYDNWECHISCSPVTEAGDNKLLIVGGYQRGATLIQVQPTAAGGYEVKELYTTLEFGDQTKPALYHDGHFYAQYGTNARRDGLCCMDVDGNIKWKTKRDPNFDKGSMILADGLILATDGANSLYLIEPSAEGFKPISKADLLVDDSGAMPAGRNGNWAPLALADGMLLIRNHSKMMCVKVTK
ncbi:MAG: PQQ-binding-like beta-propeller repeat protein [Alistipes sp.]|nr:PQQ-binding-like beta-propeller repeat protein [Alistipes sp.]